MTLLTVNSFPVSDATDAVGVCPNGAPSPQVVEIAVTLPSGWTGPSGVQAPDGVHTTIRITGAECGPVAVVLGGISADRCVADQADARGWWREMIAQRGPLDLDHWRCASFDYIGVDRSIPLTPRDHAAVLALALERAGVDVVDCLIGASFGGMVALSFAALYPERLKRLCVLSAAHRPSPMAQAWRAVQRGILQLADECGRPEEGVALARALAMTTYRTQEEFSQRFSCREEADGGAAGYVFARGRDYARKVSAQRFSSLSAAIDRHFEPPEQIETPTLIVGAEEDMICPITDLEELHARLSGPSRLIRLSSPFGHDAFLKEADVIAPHLTQFSSESFENV